jgi:hypothetical protein
VREIDLDRRPLLEPERRSAFRRADCKQRLDVEDITPPCLPARDAVELAQLLEGVYSNVRVGADAHPDAAVQDTLDR